MYSDFSFSQQECNAISHFSDAVLTNGANPDFESKIDWSLHAIASDCAAWICEGETPKAAYSFVWMLSSSNTEQLLSKFLDQNLSKALRKGVETTSLIFNWGDDIPSEHSSNDIWNFRSFAGSQVLHLLDAVLSISKLAKASHDELKAIFLALFGAVIFVGYTIPCKNFQEVVFKIS